jgi:hypothetical protein
VAHVTPSAALVTLLLGPSVTTAWRTHAEARWRRFCTRHGLDLVPVTTAPDDSPRARARSPAYQKLLLPSLDALARYDRLIWADADLILTERAPNPLRLVPPERVGAVVSGAHVPVELRPMLLKRLGRHALDPEADPAAVWAADQRSFYRAAGLPERDRILQTGLLVLTPALHAGLFRAVYDAPASSGSDRGYEQLELSQALLERDLHHALDPRFNRVFHESMLVHYPYLRHREHPQHAFLAAAAVAVELDLSFGLHFAYDASWMNFLPRPDDAASPAASP